MTVDAEYVLPLRWAEDSGLDELVAYLTGLRELVDVTVVDGSGPERFAAHASAFPAGVRHLPVEPWPGRNGKVAGVMTGLRTARHDRVVLADDDVRYDEGALRAVVGMLDSADLVRPQNLFVPAPWHARWDTGRSLLNRALGHDYPGTLAVRRRIVIAAGGYDGDVLFENLELIRTVRAAGGRVVAAERMGVARRPPAVRHFLRQRVRQAYDDLAQPMRLVAELAVLPLAIVALRRPARLLLAAAGVVALAEAGRRRAGGRRLFPATAALWAPFWLAERAVCVWLALGARARGGVRYSDGRLRRAATPLRTLRRRLAG
ncbi:glycosyltransferase [Leifsonia sp. C5G2]|uniref:glycosyltransferase n=1 Tax=Leifsonia sp. C5G2 TaxID=2735269 RepID=UPI001585C521|nr:glycosyltransferase [Leifsonia sp. C5G2]